MRKKGRDALYIRLCVYAFITVAALMLFNRLLAATDNLWRSFLQMLGDLGSLAAPFIVATIIAYILAPAVGLLQRLLARMLRRTPKGERIAQILALFIIYLLILALIGMALAYTIPGLLRNANDLLRNVPNYIEAVDRFYQTDVISHPLLQNETIRSTVETQFNHLVDSFTLSLGTLVSSATEAVTQLISGVFMAILGIVLSFYLLLERRPLREGIQRLLLARFGQQRATSITAMMNAADRIFGKYISAKILQIIVMYVLAQAAFLILGTRYSVLMSVVFALFNLIPYVGPVVGGAIPVLISYLDSPGKGLAVLIAVLVLQAIDNYVVEPKIMGDRIGISPFWVLFAVILGGGLFGLWGLLLAVPTAGFVRLLISRYILIRARKRAQAQAEAAQAQQAACTEDPPCPPPADTQQPEPPQEAAEPPQEQL